MRVLRARRVSLAGDMMPKRKAKCVRAAGGYAQTKGPRRATAGTRQRKEVPTGNQAAIGNVPFRNAFSALQIAQGNNQLSTALRQCVEMKGKACHAEA
ncbi:hypothetical protein D3C86_1830300 [compost metagenome]